jgi:hypothetical protein
VALLLEFPSATETDDAAAHNLDHTF